MHAELTDRAALAEIARRRAIDLRVAEGALAEAQAAAAMIERGQNVIDAPNLERATARVETAKAALSEVKADIAALDAAELAEAQQREQERAKAREAAIGEADAALLAARMNHDKAAGERIALALPPKPDRAAYARACEKSDSALETYLAARAAREALEE